MTSRDDSERLVGEVASSGVEAAEDASDEDRLRVLEDLYQTLEQELDRDVDETGPAGR
jgi:hypothetical protein